MQKFIQENPISSKPWGFEEIVTKAFNNKTQIKGEKNKFGTPVGSYKPFDSLQTLVSTLPINLIKTFNECVARHQILLPSAYPANCDQSTYSFDWNSAVFNGPFFDGSELIIEQQQTDRPFMQIYWRPNESKKLRVIFFKPFDKYREVYRVYISAHEAYLFDCADHQYLFRYILNSDGSLGLQKD